MSGNKALKRALLTNDAIRVNSDIPEITDITQLISPDDAQEMLKQNSHNRPINWSKVEEFAEIMRRGEWKLHPQGIILDPDGNILTGQTRLWAIIYAGIPVYMRVSRGSPSNTAFVIDRGRPQTARDLSSRRTERKHSPTEASIARCVCVLRGHGKPSTDQIATVITEKNEVLSSILKDCARTKKTKAVLMIMAAIVHECDDPLRLTFYTSRVSSLGEKLETDLLPYTVDACWGRGASFGMALKKSSEIIAAAK